MISLKEKLNIGDNLVLKYKKLNESGQTLFGYIHECLKEQ